MLGAASPVLAEAIASAPVSSAPAPGGAAGTTSVYSLDFGGMTRSYRLFVPTQLAAGPRPLLLGLHSFLTNAALFESGSRFDFGSAKGGYLAAYPDGLGNSWNAGTCCGTSSANNVDDVGFLAAVIADVAAHRQVDRNRIAVAGGSNGGMMAFRFACERSDLVDVYEVFGGAFIAPSCKLSRPISLLQVHGMKDTTVPYLGGVSANPALGTTPFPKVKGPYAGVAILDGCKGTTAAPFNGSSVATLTQASGCPSNSYVWLISSSTLAHTWSYAADVPTYGVDMSGLAFGFTYGIWLNRGPAIAL